MYIGNVIESHSGSELMEQSSQDPSSDLKNKGLLPIGGSSQLDSKNKKISLGFGFEL